MPHNIEASIGSSTISIINLIVSDIIPTLNIFHILIYPELYTIAIGGVVDGSALEIEHASAVAITGIIGFIPALLASVTAIGHAIHADAVLDAG